MEHAELVNKSIAGNLDGPGRAGLDAGEGEGKLGYDHGSAVISRGGSIIAMPQEADSRKPKGRSLSAVSAAFLENNTLLKGFLARFFWDQQDIEDVAQEAYLRAFIAEQHQRIDRPKAFLFRIAKNVALNELTKKSKQITDYIEETSVSVVMGSAAAADHEVEAEETLGLYCAAVAALPEKCRQVYLLRKAHGLARKDIAERMSLSLSSVDKYLFTGVLACRAFVRERERVTPDSSSMMVARDQRKKGK